MKITLLGLLIIFSLSLFGQHIDGPANIREKPNGENLYSINDYVLIDLAEDNPTNDWFNILLRCYVMPDRLIDKKTIKKSTTLFDSKGDSIGFTFSQFKVYENNNERYWKYDELDKIEITLSGFTYKSNIRDKISKQEIIENKLNFTDSCVSSYLTYQEENGMFVTLIEKCNLYPASLIINDKYQSVFIREKQKIRRLSGAEGQESHIEIEILSNYLTDNPEIEKFSVDADKVYINGKLIKSVKYGCCGGEDMYQLFNSSTQQKIMDYDEVLYSIRIPNSKIEGYIGYQTGNYYGNIGTIGSLVFSDGETVINKVNFVTNDKDKYQNILRFVPDMEFIPIHDKDKVSNDKIEIDLWSKNFAKSKNDLTGFKFLVHLVDDSTGKDYIQELNFINGFVNGNPKKEFDINIDE